MRLSSHVGKGSSGQDLAGNVDRSLVISETVVGSNSVSGGTPLETMTGAAAAAVDTRMLATLSVKDFAK